MFQKTILYEMRISNNLKQINFKELMKESILNELYKKASETICYHFFEAFKKYLNKEISEDEFETFKKENHFDIELLPTYGTGIRGCYDLSTKNYVIQIEKGLEIIFHSLTNEQLYTLVKKFWLWFVHEDTHKQQDDLSGGFRLGKNYICFLDSDPTNLDIQQNVDYFNQLIEADAYAREVGEILKILYNIPKEGVEPSQSGLVADIINDIKNGKTKDEDVQQITNIYWDPRINKKAKMKFFGTLYEYLYGEESRVSKT